MRERKRMLTAYSFIAPNFIGFAVFTMIPIICAFALGFLHWDGNNAIEFAGLSNFKRLLGDSIFKASLKNTIIYCIGTVPLTMIASLGLAIVLNQKIKIRGFFRTVSFFPYVASLVDRCVEYDFSSKQRSCQCDLILYLPCRKSSKLVRRRSDPCDLDLVQCMEVYGILHGDLSCGTAGDLGRTV